MIFKNDAQRKAIFASLGRNVFSSHPMCNSFAVDKKKNIERIIKRLAPKISDDFDPQTFDFWAEYDDNLSFERNVDIMAKKLEQIGAIKSSSLFMDTTDTREHEANELFNIIMREKDNVDFNVLMGRLDKDKSLKNMFRDKLTEAVFAGILPEDDYIVSQFDEADDTFHRRLSSIRQVKTSGIRRAIEQQLLDSEARRAAIEAAAAGVASEDLKEQKLSDAIGEAVEEKKEEMPNPEEKDYIKKLVDSTFRKEKSDYSPIGEYPIDVAYTPQVYE